MSLSRAWYSMATLFVAEVLSGALSYTLLDKILNKK